MLTWRCLTICLQPSSPWCDENLLLTKKQVTGNARRKVFGADRTDAYANLGGSGQGQWRCDKFENTKNPQISSSVNCRFNDLSAKSP